MDTKERLLECKLKGYCCSQTITAMILEDLNKDNEDMITAIGGFCGGMECGETCGTLAASVAMLYLVDTESAKENLREEFMSWFLENYGSYYCKDIVHGDSDLIMKICPAMVENSYNKLVELLEDKLDVD